MAIGIASFAQWGTLAMDATGDGSVGGPNFLDGTKLEYRYDNMSDSIWFRVTVTNVLNANYGINIIMNVTDGGTTAKWFGTNSSFDYNRVITAWVTSGTSGTVGITDASGFGTMNYTKLGANNIDIQVDATNKTYTLGMKRTAIYNDTVLKADIIAGVGSNQYWDDDVPNIGSGGIDVAPTLSIHAISHSNPDFTIYPNPAQSMLNIKRDGIGEDQVSLHMYNISGKKMYTGLMQPGDKSHTIDIAGKNSGIYLLKIITSENAETKTIIIK